jgi:DNA polymerase III epsilon subunit-like protein
MKILVVDLETTSHDPMIDDMRNLENSIISEIGVVRLDLETGKIEPVFDSICREDKTCSAQSWIFGNSSLTHEDVLSAEHLQAYKDELQELFDHYHATSWWHEYDFSRLEHPSRGIRIQHKFWDPALALRTYLKIPFPDGTDYKRPGVSEAYQYFNPGRTLDHPHRALKDAEIEARIIFSAVQKWPELKNNWQHYV